MKKRVFLFILVWLAFGRMGSRLNAQTQITFAPPSDQPGLYCGEKDDVVQAYAIYNGDTIHNEGWAWYSSNDTIAGIDKESGIITFHQSGTINITYQPEIPPLEIGTYYAGGIIFYIFQQGEYGYVAGGIHGLVCAVSDQASSYRWGCTSTSYGGLLGVGHGLANTINIARKCTNSAAKLCYDLQLAGYDDWFLPSRDELLKMYQNLKIYGKGDFRSAYYWSSSDYDAFGGYYVDFSNGYSFHASMTAQHYVRAVRAF